MEIKDSLGKSGVSPRPPSTGSSLIDAGKNDLESKIQFLVHFLIP